MNNIENRVIEIIKNAVNISDETTIISNTLINTLKINSLNFLKIIVDIEEEYDIEFDDEELNFDGFSTIKALVEHIDKKRNE